MELMVTGLSHHTAPVEVREALAVSDADVKDVLRQLYAGDDVSGLILLSTCNRTEIYAVGDPGCTAKAMEKLIDIQSARLAGGRQEVTRALYHKQHDEAVRHLFAVAAGLDSLAVGEPQILGQLKSAYHLASDTGAVTRILNRAVQASFSSAKRVRTETDIGRHPVSIPYAAVRLAEQIHGDLASYSALLIGAGETIALTAEHLRGIGIGSLKIANRSRERAVALATPLDADVISFDQIGAQLGTADIVVTATAADVPILGAETFTAALHARRRRPIFVVDLGVPRDIDPAVGTLSDVFLYTVDDLGQVIAENRARREKARTHAEKLIEHDVENFLHWLREDKVSLMIQAMRHDSQKIRDEAVEKALRRLNAGDAPEAVIKQLANGLTNKLLHGPTVNLRESAGQEKHGLLKAAESLFGLAKKSSDKD